jgi:hypothetical protein
MVVGIKSGTWALRGGDANARGWCSVASARRLEQRRTARGRVEWGESLTTAVRERREIGFYHGSMRIRHKAVHTAGGYMCYAGRLGGRWHASERQLARLGRSAGGRLQRAVEMMPRRVRAVERGRVGWASLSRHGLGPVSKWTWAALSSGPGSVRCTMLFRLFKNCPNLVIHVCCLPEFQKCSNFAK